MKRLLENHRLLGLIGIGVYVGFALLPDTFVNWFYDYFQFIPWWGVLACIALAVGLVCSAELSSRSLKMFALGLAIALPFCFYGFRTQIHCFGGDMMPGCVPENPAFAWSSLVPPLPGEGRLDTYGFSPFFHYVLAHGLIEGFDGMTTMVGYALYDILVGVIFVALVAALFHGTPMAMLIVLSSPFVFNFFGNVDCYPLPICSAMVFLSLTKWVFSKSEPSFSQMLLYGTYWLFCGWVHPIAGVAGFLPAIICIRWWNRKCPRFHIPETVATLLFGVVFFAANVIGYGKPFFSAAWNDVPPVFSWDTVVHTLNICVLPILPIAVSVLLGAAPRQTKQLCLHVYLVQLLCFCVTHFTQGANDQFPYSLYMIGMLIPWLSVAMRYPLSYRAGMNVVALNALLLVPMVWVHSTDRTVDRAVCLYAKDRCKHNKEMSWQTHLGLVLGDNLIDNATHKRCTLQVFANGARHAEPAGFRGGNHLYHTAFLYHFGEFARGRQQMAELVKRDPSVVRYFLSVRPGFAYMNRQRLWDDLYELFPQCPAKEQLKRTLDDLRVHAQKERYCLRNPKFAVCPY